MQWPDDLLEVVWDNVRDNGMWLANLKKRLWKGVHTDLFSLITDTHNLSGYAFVPRRREGTMKDPGYLVVTNEDTFDDDPITHNCEYFSEQSVQKRDDEGHAICYRIVFVRRSYGSLYFLST